MRIVFVHNRYRSEAPSGENRVVEQEAAVLRQAGCEVEVFGESSDVLAEMSVLRKALVPGRVVWSDRTRRRLRALIRDQRPDVVHVHNTFPLASASVVSACRQEDVPVVATLHNYRLICSGSTLFRDGQVCHECLPTHRNSVLPGVHHGCYRGSRPATIPIATSILAHGDRWRHGVEAFLTLSSAQRDLFVTCGFPPSRTLVKPNFVPDPGYGPDPGPGLHLLYLGRLAPEKGIVLLQQAWEQVVHEAGGAPALPLVIGGGGPLEDEVIAWSKRTPGVSFVGHRPPEECQRLTRDALAVVVPSVWQETFGLVVVEAMAASVPAIAPRHASFPDLIDDGCTGVLYQPDATGELAHQMASVMVERAWARRLGDAARRRYEECYTPERGLAKLLGAYGFACENRLGR